jgi:hypothetical protein
MKLEQNQIIDVLKNTPRTKKAMSNLAKDLSELNPEQYRSLANELADSFEGPALGNLLTVSAINRVKLCTGLLIKSMRVVDDLKPIYYASSLLDAEAIEALNAFAFDNYRTNPQFAITAAKLALELSLKFNQHRSQVKFLLDIFRNNEMSFVNKQRDEAINVFAKSNYGDNSYHWNTKLNPMDDLPDVVKDVIHPLPMYKDIPPFEVGKMLPENLDMMELVDYFGRAMYLGFYNKCFDFLEELDENYEFEKTFMMARLLYFHASMTANNDLINKLDMRFNGEHLGVRIDQEKALLTSMDGLDCLNSMSFHSLLDPNYFDVTELFKESSMFVEKYFPALDILFKRAAIVAYPMNNEETANVIHRIRFTRATMGLDPENDPVEKVYQWIKDGKGNNKDEVKHLQNRLIKKDKAIENLNMEVHELKEKTIGDLDYQQLKKENHELTLEIAKQKIKLKNWKLMIAEEKEKNDILQKQLNTSELN